jgi:hypothetical protein
MVDDENPPSGDRAIFWICELFAVPFAFDAVERVRAGDRWTKVAASTLIALVLMGLGIYFPKIRQHLGKRVSGFLDQLTHNRRFWKASSFIVVVFLVLRALVFFAEMRSDLDTYSMPRTVTKEQAAKIRDYLSHYQPYSVTMRVVENNEEANRYAALLADALQQGHWVIKSWSTFSNGPNSGIGLDVTGPKESNDPIAPSPDMILVNAFSKAEVDNFSASFGQRDEPYAISITVTNRPLAIQKNSWLEKSQTYHAILRSLRAWLIQLIPPQPKR